MSEDPIGFAGGDANLFRYAGNQPTFSRDPSGLAEVPEEPFPRVRPSEREKSASPHGPNTVQGRIDRMLEDFLRVPVKKIRYPGQDVYKLLGIEKYSGFWSGIKTLDYLTLEDGCIGLNRLRTRLASPFLKGARVFSSLEDALLAQKEMQKTSATEQRVVITAVHTHVPQRILMSTEDREERAS